MTNLGKSIVGIIIIVVVLAGGYYFTSTSKDALSMDTTKEEQSNVLPVAATGTQPTSGKKMAFSQFLTQGGAHTCTVNQNIGDTTAKGTVYVSGDKVSGEFSATIDGKSMTTNFIVRDGYTYTWTSMMPTMGFKIKKATAESTTTQTQTNGWSADQIGDYSCDTWATDESKFTLPASVKFTLVGSN